MSPSVQAFLISGAEMFILMFAISIARKYWLAVFVGTVAMTLAFLDGHFYWGQHDLLTSWLP